MNDTRKDNVEEATARLNIFAGTLFVLGVLSLWLMNNPG